MTERVVWAIMTKVCQSLF